MERKDHPSLFRFIFLYLAFLGSSFWVYHTWSGSWILFMLSLLIFGLVGCSMFAAEHEIIHNTAFKSPLLTNICGFLAGVAHMYPPGLFRELHFTHHRYTHIPGKDPEISLGEKPAPEVIRNLPMYMGWITGFPLLGFKLMMLIAGAFGMPEPLRKNIYPFVRPKMRSRIMLESWAVLLPYAFLLYCLFVHDFGFIGIFIGQVISHCFVAAYTIMEHNGLPHEGNIFEKTRSIRANRFLKLMMWNMPYHAEHHAYPGVPFHALPYLHEELESEIVNGNQNHGDFHLQALKSILKKY